MKLRISLLALTIASCTGIATAQQDKLLTHFMYDRMSVNPGETGLDEGICATTIYRNQWDKVNGAPNSAVLNVAANMNRFFPGGVGLSFYHDAIGFSRQNNLLLNYSYPISLGNVGTLGAGIGVGLISYAMNPNWIPPQTMNDPSLPGTDFSAMSLDMNFGLFLKGNNYYAGLSSTHLSESELLGSSTGLGTVGYNTARHYYLMGGYKLPNVGNGALDFNLMARTDLVKYSVDINTRYFLKKDGNELGYAGLTYRTSDALGIMLGYNAFKSFTVGYSYDLTLNKLSSISRGSHEMFVKYCYYLPIPPKTYSTHPRWLGN
ncbi:MAG: type IX secretion system membrane protein PorP/SprF [Flavobacteriia bacterium]|jgi:type IX secretion system PorP/SprF family membrane protein|nr:type IX secretion system membrane protein PorP/SprF [Flavobacteriia bacterium]